MANTASINLERWWQSALYPIFMRQMLSGGSLDSLFLYLKLTQTAEKDLNKENWFLLMALGISPVRLQHKQTERNGSALHVHLTWHCERLLRVCFKDVWQKSGFRHEAVRLWLRAGRKEEPSAVAHSSWGLRILMTVSFAHFPKLQKDFSRAEKLSMLENTVIT